MGSNEWQPIETAPKDGSQIKIKMSNGYESVASWWTTYGGEWHVGSFKNLPWADQHRIRHWMLLPEPPK